MLKEKYSLRLWFLSIFLITRLKNFLIRSVMYILWVHVCVIQTYKLILWTTVFMCVIQTYFDKNLKVSFVFVYRYNGSQRFPPGSSDYEETATLQADPTLCCLYTRWTHLHCDWIDEEWQFIGLFTRLVFLCRKYIFIGINSLQQ